MNSSNPYAASGMAPVREPSTFSVENLSVVLKPSRLQIIFFLTLSLIFALIGMAALMSMWLLDSTPLWATVIALTFLCFSYIGATAPFTAVTIDETALRMHGFRNAVFAWHRLKSWRKDTNTGLLFVKDALGKESMIANLAVTEHGSEQIVRAFKHFLGEETEQTPESGKL